MPMVVKEGDLILTASFCQVTQELFDNVCRMKELKSVFKEPGRLASMLIHKL